MCVVGVANMYEGGGAGRYKGVGLDGIRGWGWMV